ncbi:MAG: DUF4230 domain-containing protein [Saprospiraceae bacterium]
MKKTILLLALLLAVLFGFFATRWYYSWQERVVTEQSQVLLEKIKTVAKLVTVEGYFSDVYDYKDYYSYDLSPFRKKALLRVKATVSVGYDLENMTITSFPEQKLIQIKNLPQPQIIAIDHDVDYYDLTEGTFNSFSESDLTQLNDKAKNYIRKQAEESELIDAAVKQGNQMLEVITIMAENAGWKVEIDNGFVKN